MTKPVLSRRAFGAALAGAAGLALAGGCAAKNSASSAAKTGAASTSGGLFDDAVVHDIAVTFDDGAYDEMIAAYLGNGDKGWIEATVTIDGATYEKAGLRLKGNSSLRELSADDKPEDLPWLVRLDKFTDGQEHGGYTEFVVRSNNSRSALNEAVALELLGLAGLATQDSVSARLGVNGSDAALRLVIENPGDKWDADNFPSAGILYKAEAGGDYSYRGEDAASYEDVFDQETGGDDEVDLAPLIAFLKFVNESDDATFGSDLAKHLDVPAFAKYLAFEELVANSDDIDGPGNNSYLRYTSGTGLVTVVAWDHNLAFGGMGGGRGQGQQGQQGRQGQAPQGQGMPTGERPRNGGGGPGGRGNILVQRFQANATFKAAYQQALTDLKAALYTSGEAAKILKARAAILTDQAGGLLSADTVTEEAGRIEAYFG
jgi:spore coat protein CotH